MQTITDPDDPRVAAFRLNERGLNPRLRRTEATPPGLFVAEGDLVVARALAHGCRCRALLVAPKAVERSIALMDAAVPSPNPAIDAPDVFIADDDVRRIVTGLGVPLDVVGLFERPPTPPLVEVLATARRIVVVDHVDNPTNIGAIVRSATALGADALLFDHTSADPLTRRALRVSMGAALLLPTARIEDTASALRDLHAAGVDTVALTPDESATPLGDLVPDERIALVLGAERTGLEQDVLEACRHRGRIEMAHGVDSLNVAAAAAVACYALFGNR